MATKISDKIAHGMINFLEDEDQIMQIMEMNGYSDLVCSNGIKKLKSEEKVIQIMEKVKEVVDANTKISIKDKYIYCIFTWQNGIRMLKSDEKIMEMMKKANLKGIYQSGIVMLTSKENILKTIEMSGYEQEEVFNSGIWLLEKIGEIEKITQEAKENIEDIKEEIQKFREEN